MRSLNKLQTSASLRSSFFWRKDFDFLFPAFDFIKAERDKVKLTSALLHRLARNEDARQALGQAFQPARQIDCVADRSVFQPLLRADQGHNRRTRMYADADVEVRFVCAQGLFET